MWPSAGSLGLWEVVIEGRDSFEPLPFSNCDGVVWETLKPSQVVDQDPKTIIRQRAPVTSS